MKTLKQIIETIQPKSVRKAMGIGGYTENDRGAASYHIGRGETTKEEHKTVVNNLTKHFGTPKQNETHYKWTWLHPAGHVKNILSLRKYNEARGPHYWVDHEIVNKE